MSSKGLGVREIRKWFGGEAEYDLTSPYHKELDDLLSVMKGIMGRYFGAKISEKSLSLYIHSYIPAEADKGRVLFKAWLIEKVDKLQSFANRTEEVWQGELAYCLYCARDTLDHEDLPEDMRAELISQIIMLTGKET